LRIISRAEWGARPPKYRIAIPLPSPELWLHHSVSASGGASRIRGIQNFHMDENGWPDIAYTFLINHEGLIYEGVPPGFRGTHTAGHNTSGHAICLLGNFNTTQPTEAALESLVSLIEHGHNEEWWPEVLTGGHRDTRGNAVGDCPGNKLYALIPEINEEASMPTAEEIALAVWNVKVTRAGVPIPVIQEVADIKTMVSFLRQDAQNLSDAELASAVNNLAKMINAQPQKVIDLLKSKL